MVTAVEERWQTKIKNLSEGIRHLWETKEFADVTFFVRGKPFRAHRLVLSSRSSELARLLMSHNASDEMVVPPPITENGFRVFLSFIYTNELKASDKKSVVEAYQCARHYEQKALQSKCLEEIGTWELDAEDACDLLGLEWNVPALQDKCIDFIRSHGRQVVASEAFAGAGERTVTTALASGALADVPVLQRIEGVMNWGQRHLAAADGDYSPVRQKLLDADPPLMAKLGFEQLGVEDLPHLLNYPNLLTDREVSQFLRYSKWRNAADLPSWYTSEK